MYSKISENIKLLNIVLFKVRSFESQVIDKVYLKGDIEQSCGLNQNGVALLVSSLFFGKRVQKQDEGHYYSIGLLYFHLKFLSKSYWTEIYFPSAPFTSNLLLK